MQWGLNFRQCKTVFLGAQPHWGPFLTLLKEHWDSFFNNLQEWAKDLQGVVTVLYVNGLSIFQTFLRHKKNSLKEQYKICLNLFGLEVRGTTGYSAAQHCLLGKKSIFHYIYKICFRPHPVLNKGQGNYVLVPSVIFRLQASSKLGA